MNVPKDNEGLEDQFMNEKFIQFQTGCEDEREILLHVTHWVSGTLSQLRITIKRGTSRLFVFTFYFLFYFKKN